MQRQKPFLIAALVLLSLFLVSSFAVAEVTGGNKEIGGPHSGDVVGNDSDDIPLTADDRQVYNNHVIIKSSGIVTGNAYGGYSEGDGAIYLNTVTINGGGSVGVDVYGGFSKSAGHIYENAVTINGGATVGGDVYGGKTGGLGRVNNNSVEISGTISGNAYGGVGVNGNVSANTVIINSTGSVIDVIGGFSTNVGNIRNNIVVISSTVHGNAYGGKSMGYGEVTGNKVIIKDGGTVTGNVYGGYINPASLSTAEVKNNTVIIQGEVLGDVFGGYTKSGSLAENNIVTIENTARLTNANLYGRNDTTIGTGNILTVNNFCGDVRSISNFDIYNFMLGYMDISTPVIHITGTDAVDLAGTDIYIGFTPEFMNNNLKAGDVITVIDWIELNDPDNVTLSLGPSPFIAYNFNESYNTGALLLTFTGLSLKPETKAISEGFAAGLAFLGQAADVRSNFHFIPQASRLVPFATMVYGSQEISTGSSVTVKGYSALAGLAVNSDLSNGDHLTLALFIEGGWGDYNSRNSFSNFTRVRGKGDTEYYGGGLLVSYTMTCGLYGEGSFAAGKTETDFKSWDFMSVSKTKYDFSVPYYSAHLTLGKILSLGDTLDLDVYAKYLWTRQAGDNVTVDGYRFKFKDTDSHRVRAGAKLKADMSPQLQPYAGAAFEYEFSGKVKGSLYGMHLDEPSLRGSTGLGELGLIWNPSKPGSMKVDLGIQGYVGKREGVSGGLTVIMAF